MPPSRLLLAISLVCALLAGCSSVPSIDGRIDAVEEGTTPRPSGGVEIATAPRVGADRGGVRSTQDTSQVRVPEDAWAEASGRRRAALPEPSPAPEPEASPTTTARQEPSAARDEAPNLVRTARASDPTPAPPPPSDRGPEGWWLRPKGRLLHLAPDGSGPDRDRCEGGDAAAPWGSVAGAMWCLRPGDTLLVADGVYEERVSVRAVEARPDRPIVVAAEPGARPIVRGFVRLDMASHWHLIGLSVTTDGLSYTPGQYLLKMRGGSGWTVRDGHFWDVHSYGAVRIEPSGSHNQVPVRNWRLLDNCIHDTRPTNGVRQDHNLYVVTGSAGGGLIEGNIVYGAPNGENLKFSDSTGGAHDIRVRYNTFHGATQNVLLYGETSGVVFERNLMGPLLRNRLSQPWYPNVRGFDLRGSGNLVRETIGWGAARLVLTGHDELGSTHHIGEGPGNRFGTPVRYDSTASCDGFRPLDAWARNYGAWASRGGPR